MFWGDFMKNLEKEIMAYIAQLDEYHKRAVLGFVKRIAEQRAAKQ